jgi:hypothetical protein
MKKILLVALLVSLCAVSNAAPVVVTPGSNAGYLYFPKGSGGDTKFNENPGGRAGVTIDGMQLASTACYTTSGSATLPTGFTRGFVQAIIVGGGEGVTGGPRPPGQASSITHAAIGTVTASGGRTGVAGSKGGSMSFGVSGETMLPGGPGGGGGGYLGRGGDGGDSPSWPAPGGGGGGSRGGGGQGFGYGETEAGRGGRGSTGVEVATPSPAGAAGSVGIQAEAPALILCPNVPGPASALGGSGFGAGAGGGGPWVTAQDGGNSGQIATVVFRYEGGPITVVVGAGGSGANPGVVAIRFIPQ